jgi:hypothetical protein
LKVFARITAVMTVLFLAACAAPQDTLIGGVASGNEGDIVSGIQSGAQLNTPTPVVLTGADAHCSGTVTALQLAVCRGDLAVVQVLLAHGADPNLAGTPAPAAGVGSRRKRAHRADANAEGIGGEPPLAIAAAAGNFAIVRALIAAKAEADDTDTHGRTALMVATNSDIARSLLDAGAQLDDVDAEGNSALCLAAANGRADVVSVLLGHGADVLHRNSAGLLAAELAAHAGTGGAEVIKAIGAAVRPRVDALMQEAHQSISEGNRDGALQKYVAAAALSKAGGHAFDMELRRRILREASAWDRPAPVPDAAREHAIRADVMLKHGKGADDVAREMIQAVDLAPWWADGYFNLGLLLGNAGHYRGAMDALHLYLDVQTTGPRVTVAKDKIVEFELDQEEADKLLALAGAWRDPANRPYWVSVTGNQMQVKSADGGLSIDARIDGQALHGSIQGRAYQDGDGCTIPAQTHNVDGKIGSDGRSLELEYPWSSYATQIHCEGILGDPVQCASMGLMSRVCDAVTINATNPVAILLQKN